MMPKFAQTLMNPEESAAYFSSILKNIHRDAESIMLFSQDVKKVLYDSSHSIVYIVIKYDIQLRLSHGKKTHKAVFLKSGNTASITYLTRCIRLLQKKGFNHSPFLVPDVVYRDTKNNVLIQEEATGSLLNDLIEKNDQRCKRGIILSAQWLVKLHAIPVDSQSLRISRKQRQPSLNFISAWSSDKRMKQIQLDIFLLSTSLFERMATLEKRLRTPRYVHGDFHTKNMIISSDSRKISVIDFSDFYIGDPLFDVATMTEQLGFHYATSLGIPKTKKLQSVFLQEYARQSQTDLTEKFSQERINYYTSIVQYHNLLHDIKRFQRERKSADEIFQMLRKARSFLDNVLYGQNNG